MNTKFRSLFMTMVLFVSACAGNVQPEVSDDDRERRIQARLAAANPIAAHDSLWIEELTYIEVRDLIADGHTTVIIPTGGIEQNGPYLATGKHNFVLRAHCPAIARELGNALCAPIIAIAPPDNPLPTGAMRYPGSVTVREETYQAILDDVASGFKLHGFKNIVFIGDSGGHQRSMETAAAVLEKRWTGSGVSVHFVEEYYSPGWEETERYTEEVLGVAESKKDGHHDDIWVTAMMMVVDPDSVRYHERLEAGLASINGVSIASLQETIELGRKMVAFRAAFSAKAIRAAIEGQEKQGD